MANILPALILYQHRQDMAVGLNYPSRQTREFIYFYEHQNRMTWQVNEALNTAFILGIIKGGRQRAKEIMESVNERTPPDEANRLYTEYQIIQDKVNEAVRALKDG